MPQGISQNKNILDLNFSVRSEIERNLYENWRDLLTVVTEGNPHFSLRHDEIREIERELGRLHGCPVARLLNRWGDLGMTVSQLANSMDSLKLERPLSLIRDPQDLHITEDVQNNVTVDQGRRLQLQCKAVGFPYPKYIWFRGKTQLHGGYDGVLTIDPVGMEDAGPYICRVHNTLKQFVFGVWCIVTVNRVNHPVRLPVSPTPNHSNNLTFTMLSIIEQPAPYSITIRIRKCIHLKCRATGDPSPTYQWIRGDTWLQGKTSSELKIDAATLNDSGQYRCVVRSGSQEVISDTVDVTVHSTQTRTGMIPLIIVQPSHVMVCLSGIAYFQVKARGNAPLRYTWFHNGTSIPGADTEDLKVTVTSEREEGTYQCHVSTDQPDCLCMSREARLDINREYIQYTATDKVALLIGISRYRGNSPRLPAVINDIYFTRRKLEELKFKVISLVDLDLGEMHKAISWFCDLLGKGVYGLFYVAGHGFQYQGQHYLVPWDAREGVKLSDCLCIQEVQMRAQQKKPAVLLMFLDICRKESMTIDQSEQATRYQPDVAGNSCIFFSSSHGQEAFEPIATQPSWETVIPHLLDGFLCNSMFSQFLLPVLATNKPIADVFMLLMDGMRGSPVYKKLYQNPEMHINLMEHNRSLADPIFYEDDRLAYNDRTELWFEMHKVPQKVDLGLKNLHMEIGLQFQYFFSNVLCLTVIPPVDKLGIVQQIGVIVDSIPEVEPVEVRNGTKDSPITLVVFQNLQKLDRRLKPVLQLRLNKHTSWIRVPELDLGWPLVSQLQQKAQMANPVGRREPTEQDENP